jgi:biopolymer transport protein TolR
MPFGRLERSDSGRPMAEINVTPLVDVMLVLLVIFIITAPLMASSIKLDLPRSAAAQPGTPPQSISVVVTPDGQIHLDERAVSPAQLSDELARRAAQAPDTEVQLRADAAVPYGRVVEVMGLAQQAGLNRIGFVAEAPPAPKP